MAVVRFIGDVHGKYEQYKRIIKDGPPSIQVGDLGVGFRRLRDGLVHSNPPHYAMAPNHRFIRGNHDNPGECRKHSQYIPDGHIENGIMFVGGAVSIDKQYRTEGYSWWADEELSPKELKEIERIYAEAKPRIMVTHDAPQEIATRMAALSGMGMKLEPEWDSRTRHAFQRMWDAHKPAIWIFGHWHNSLDLVVEGTRFICLAELEAKDLEV